MNQSESERIRREYEETGLSVSDLAATPMAQFDRWFSDAVAAGVEEPNAFVLATASSDGVPSARAVLLKESSDSSLTFYTNMASRKSREISANPSVAATFVWISIHRQVRFEGTAKPIAEETADAYFATRPRGAQIAAYASHQSQVASSREEMESRYAEMEASFGEVIRRPEWWSGWEITPRAAEFWQGRANRFHDRFRYEGSGGEWQVVRLQP